MSTPAQAASPRRLQRARQAGDFPRSSLLKRAIIWGAGLCVLPSATVSLWTWGREQIRSAINASATDLDSLASAARTALTSLVKLSLPLLLVASVTALAAHVAEARSLSFEKGARSRAYRAGTLDRLAQIFSGYSLASKLLQVVGAATLAGYSWQWWRKHAVDVAATLGQVSKARQLSIITAMHLAWIALFIGLAVGGIDFLMAWRSWLQRLKLSRTEQLQEQRESEGDPLLKSQRARLRQDCLVEPPLNPPIEATLVVHAHFHQAIMLRYVPSESATPRILQVSVGHMARRFIEDSLRLNIAVVEDSVLSGALAHCEAGAPIPEALYTKVAELLGELAIDAASRP